MMSRKKFWIVTVVVTLIMTAYAGAAQAGEPDEGGGWEFAILPYLWALALDGNVTVKGLETDVDMSFGDIWDNLNIAFMCDIEARKGRFGLFVNPLYAELEGEQSKTILHTVITVDATIKMFIMGFGIDYRLGPYAIGNTAHARTPTVTVVPYLGGRYTDLDVKLDITRYGHISGTTTYSSFEDGKHWVDPIIGARTIWGLSRHWNIIVSGDVGGFGVGSDFAWSANGLFGYRFGLFGGKDNANFLFGYRALCQDYKEGSGADLFEYKATMHGPIVGLGIGF